MASAASSGATRIVSATSGTYQAAKQCFGVRGRQPEHPERYGPPVSPQSPPESDNHTAPRSPCEHRGDTPTRGSERPSEPPRTDAPTENRKVTGSTPTAETKQKPSTNPMASATASTCPVASGQQPPLQRSTGRPRSSPRCTSHGPNRADDDPVFPCAARVASGFGAAATAPHCQPLSPSQPRPSRDHILTTRFQESPG
jgi:hypothetical protein